MMPERRHSGTIGRHRSGVPTRHYLARITHLLLALVTAAFGALGGLGGAVLLVPVLVLTGTEPAEAGPLGLVSVAAASLAAAPLQLRERSVNHRLGVLVELVASTAAVVGAIVSGVVAERTLTLGLAGVAALAAVAAVRRRGLRNPPDPRCTPADVGERVGRLAGAYPLGAGIVPYEVRRLPAGLALMAVSGFIAGTAGVSGGFVKTPALSEVMGVPSKVAAATTTFTLGITASTALAIYAIQGRVDPRACAGVIAGSLIGGRLGAHVQSRLSPVLVRRVLCALLLVVAAVLVVRA